MKLFRLPGGKGWHDPARKPRAPLISFTEAAEHFEISPNRLKALMAHNPGYPKPELRHHSFAQANSWYVRAPMLAWIKGVLEAQKERT